MKLLKLAAIPAALLATSAFAEDVVVDQQVVAEPVAVSTTTYNPDSGIVKNTTTQLVDGTKSVFGTIFHPAAVSVEAGSLGYGANLGWALNDKTELVAGWAGGDVSTMKDEIELRDTTYDMETDFSNAYVGVQMRPASNWFTVGTGVIVPDDEITLKAQPNSSNTVKINNSTYLLPSTSRLDATVENKNDIAPYLTIGFRPNLNNHWGVFGEIGAAYTGGLEVTKAHATGIAKITGPDKVGAVLDSSELKQQLQADVNDSDYSEWFPIAKLGLTYRF